MTRDIVMATNPVDSAERSENMPKKNAKKSSQHVQGNSNPFELLDGITDDEVIIDESTVAAAATSSRGRALKRTQPFEPNSPPAAKRANSQASTSSTFPPPPPPRLPKATRATKAAKTTKAAPPPPPPPSAAPRQRSSPPNIELDIVGLQGLLDRVYDALDKADERAERAEAKIDSLEKLITTQLLPRLIPNPRDKATNKAAPTPPPSPPISPPRQIPGIGLDVSRLRNIPENAGVVRKRVDEALKEKGITCKGVNDKGNGRYRLLFRAEDIDEIRRDNKWLSHFEMGRIYGDQWYPIRLDRVHTNTAVDAVGCELFGRANGCKVHKMRWLGNITPPKEGETFTNKQVYRSMVIYLDSKEEVDRLLKEGVALARGKSIFTHPWLIGLQPLRCYRYHLYGHLHYRYKAPTPFCGQCALPGHAASICTSTTFKCAYCKGPHKATDPGCPVYRREKEKLRPSPLI